MHPLMLGIEILTLVPNHLSTVKNYQSTTSISHPYSSLFTTFHPSNLKTPTLHQSGEEKRGGGSEKESGGEKEKGVEMRMRRRKRGVEKV